MSSTRPTMTALLIAIFVSSIPATLILPMIPSLGVEFGVAPAELGLLVGIYPLMSMLASPFWGRLSDRYGRKPILIATLAGGALAFLCFALSTSWIGLFAGRALQGLAGTPRGIGFAVASDMSEDEDRSASMGKVTAAMAVAFMLGPLIGGLFMGENPDSWAGQLRTTFGLPAGGFNHVLPSLIGVMMNIGGLLVILNGFKETWHPQKDKSEITEKNSAKHNLKEAILHTSVVLAIIFFLLSGFIQGSLQFSFTLWADMTFGWTAQWIAWAGAIIGLGFALGSGVLLRPMLKRIGQEKTVFTGTIIDVVGLSIFLLLQSSPLLALTGLLISSTGGALWATTILGLLSRDIAAEDQGMVLGIANGAALLGRVVGPVFAGYLAVSIAPGAPFAIILICVIMAAARGAILVRHA
jgi:DHA1 family tetracycline resistance protein-like MFS transporter